MSVDSDKLRAMINNYPTLTANLSAGLDNLQAQIDDYTEQQSALDSAHDGLATDLENYIVVSAGKADKFYSYGDFNDGTESANLTDWIGYDQEAAAGLTYVSSDLFTVSGDQTSTYTAGVSAIFTNGGTFTTGTAISGSLYNTIAYPLVTLVGVDAAVLTATLDGVYLEAYQPSGPLWDSDATVQGYMDDFDFILDYIWQDLGTGGTYGVEDTIDKLTDAYNILLLDYNKYSAAGDILEPYAT
jgi:hypothetical protein